LDEGTAAVAPRVRVERDADVAVVALAGEHDVSTRHRVREAIDDALDARLSVVIDLRDAAFVDSVIAATLLEARKKAKREDIGLGIVLADGHENAVRRMFELSRLTSVFAIYPSLETAVAAVREGFAES
jgi:anti-anti-sigma factor